jgi:hypothetical protein
MSFDSYHTPMQKSIFKLIDYIYIVWYSLHVALSMLALRSNHYRKLTKGGGLINKPKVFQI